MIVFDGDSAWGEVDGTPELASEIFAARSQKPIIAVVNTLAASAASWLAAQADEIVISPSAQAGSIGVWVLHQDLSGLFEKMGVKNTLLCAGDHKVDANPSSVQNLRPPLLHLVERGAVFRGVAPARPGQRCRRARRLCRLRDVAKNLGEVHECLDRGDGARALWLIEERLAALAREEQRRRLENGVHEVSRTA